MSKASIGGRMRAEGDGDFTRQILDNLYDGVYFVDLDRRITYWNKGAERITGYTAEEVVEHSCHDGLLRHVDNEGNPICGLETCPAAGTMRTGIPCEERIYLRHKDGHRVPVAARISSIHEGGEVVGAVEVITDDSSALATRQRIEELERLALLDELTGIGNRRHADMHLEARLEQFKRYGWPFALLFLDIDNFKKFNDTYGHEVGDRMLKVISRSTQGAVRAFDIVSRWGGEEFTAIIENIDLNELWGIAEKVRTLVEQSSVSMDGDVIGATISVGATMGRPEDTVVGLVKRADELMYESKKAGRNRVTLG